MARTPTIIPQEVKEQMCRDYRQGMSVRQISNIYGIGTNKIYDTLKQNKCEIKVGRKPRQCDIVVQSMMEDYINGLSVGKIAKKYGCSYVHVFRLFSQNNFDVREHRRPTRKDDVIEALKLGELSQSEIARKCGVSRQFVLIVKKELEEKNNAVVEFCND